MRPNSLFRKGVFFLRNTRSLTRVAAYTVTFPCPAAASGLSSTDGKLQSFNHDRVWETYPPAEGHGEASPRGDAARQCLLSYFESRIGSETAPAQFREQRRPEPSRGRGSSRATSDLHAPRCPAPPATQTYDFRAAVPAGVLEARLALLVGTVPEARVLNLQGRDGPKSGAKSAAAAAPPARPPAPRGADKGKQSLRADGRPGEIALRGRRSGAPGCPNFSPPGPTRGALRPRRRPSASPHIRGSAS